MTSPNPNPEPAQAGSPWRPFSEAPRDGTSIQLKPKSGSPVDVLYWTDAYSIHGLGGCWTDVSGCTMSDFDYEGWQPLPAPLQAAAGPTAEEVLNFIQANCLTVECYDSPTPGGDDSQEMWRVIEYHMSKPRERYIGFGDTPQAAIRDALKGTKQDER